MKKAYMRFAHDPKEGEEVVTDSPLESQEGTSEVAAEEAEGAGSLVD